MPESEPPHESPDPETISVDESVTLDQGIEAMKADAFEKAINIFGAVLEKTVTEHGKLGNACATPAYYYGISLLRMAQSSKEIFLEKEVPVQTDDQEDTSDLSIAWEQLDLARHLLELDTDNTHHDRLADIHVGLGDVACESSNFEAAMMEYKSAIGHLDALQNEGSQPGIHRRYCEVYYEQCLAHEFMEELELAAECCEKAITSIREELEAVEDEATRRSLEEIECDLLERKKGIDIGIEEKEQVSTMLRQLFNQQPQQNQAPSPTAHNIGVVGRGKRRIQLTRIDEEDVTESSGPTTIEDPLETSHKKLKRDDDTMPPSD